MAIGRLNVRVGKKGKGLAHVNYILREDKYKPHAEKLEHLEKKDLVICHHGRKTIRNYFGQ